MFGIPVVHTHECHAVPCENTKEVERIKKVLEDNMIPYQEVKSPEDFGVRLVIDIPQTKKMEIREVSYVPTRNV